MLLKVSDGDGGWILIDNVDQAHLVSKRHTVKSVTELHSLEGDALVLVSKDAIQGKGEITVGVVEFERNGTIKRALFTDVVYVCDNKGDTLDRLSLNRSDRRR